MKNYRIMMAGICLFLGVQLKAQEFKEDISSMNKAYAGLTNFSTEVTVQIFAGDNSSRPMAVKKAVIKKKEQNYYYTIDDLTMLMNDKYIIMVNTSLKNIVVNNRDKASEAQNLLQVANLQMDSIAVNHGEVKYLGIENKCKHYQVLSKKSLIAQTDIYIDPETSLITMLDYRYSAQYKFQTRAIVRFTNMNLHAGLSDREFAEDKFFHQSGKEFKTSPHCSGYKIVLAKNEKH